MNKFYAIILLLLANVAAMAQLQNASFENWTSHSYDDPTGFMTGNQKSPHNGLIPITRVSGHSGYGVRIETMISQRRRIERLLREVLFQIIFKEFLQFSILHGLCK